MLADKLRKSVLQSAIQGKLTEQLATDDNVEDLLQAIEEEKELLIKEKKIKKQKPLPEITEDEIPFAIPENWKWVRLGEIGITQTGNTPSRLHSEYIGNDIPFITPKDISDKGIIYNNQGLSELGKTVARICNKDTILQVCIGGSIGKTNIVNREVAFNQQINSIYPIFCISRYVFMVMQSAYFIIKMRNKAGGTATPIINRGIWDTILIPLPSLAEQKRIVEKLDNVLANIEKLKSSEEKLSILQKNFPDKLKKSILQSAIQGKLTEQLATDDNVEDLLQAIKEEKERLIKEKKIKKQKPLPEITEEEIPFTIPENWKWVRLDDICVYLQRGKSPIYSDIKKYPVVSQKCNQWSGFTLEPAKYLAPEVLEKYADERYLKKHDILINSTGLGTVGRVCLFKTDSKYPIVVADSHVTVVRSTRLISEIYIKYFLSSPHIQDNIEDMCSGSTKQKELALNTIKNLLVALPPLAEQKRIVEKLDKLLADIEELKI
jgi:type I restriction enzyme S subunit